MGVVVVAIDGPVFWLCAICWLGHLALYVGGIVLYVGGWPSIIVGWAAMTAAGRGAVMGLLWGWRGCHEVKIIGLPGGCHGPRFIGIQPT